jgi:hypothetical protein
VPAKLEHFYTRGPKPPSWPWVREMIGRSNARPFAGHPAGTVVFNGVIFVLKQDPPARYSFAFDPLGWNEGLLVDTHGAEVYPRADFSGLPEEREDGEGPAALALTAAQ